MKKRICFLNIISNVSKKKKKKLNKLFNSTKKKLNPDKLKVLSHECQTSEDSYRMYQKCINVFRFKTVLYTVFYFEKY